MSEYIKMAEQERLKALSREAERRYNARFENSNRNVYVKRTPRPLSLKDKIVNQFKIITIAFVLMMICIVAIEFLATPIEKFSTTARYHLMQDLEAGDAKALEYYWEEFVTKGDMLFDGPVTFKMLAMYIGIPEHAQTLYDEYLNGTYENANEFFDTFVLDLLESAADEDGTIYVKFDFDLNEYKGISIY